MFDAHANDLRPYSTVIWHRVVRALIYTIAFIFLVLVVIGNISNKPVLREIYFLKIDLADIIPLSVPNAVLINSVARSIGLHDFYQVGLWNFCEGYEDTGITTCSKPEPLYAFNPVQIILNELLAGATIALPAEVMDALEIARIASRWMFGLFLTGTVLSFLAIFITPWGTSSRPPQAIAVNPNLNGPVKPHRRRTFILLRSFPMVLFTFATALCTVVASAVATVMFTIFRNVFLENGVDLNIQAELGVRMLVFMWIASGFTLLGFIVQLTSCCCACCGGRRARRQLRHQDVADEKTNDSS